MFCDVAEGLPIDFRVNLGDVAVRKTDRDLVYFGNLFRLILFVERSFLSVRIAEKYLGILGRLS